ncbi:PIR protein [Plasmodium vivax]|uniref:Variable surface protein Vir18 n=1 Tax=Plasmodium vivax North Korean TaxID=1035514 RepID=A0A0J9W718_PLAVI|nr:hypothetical protein PVNG_06316 [Plasmodium vivax North Korean]CAI7723928.1 PIR protein [Plasmodium vivax]
MRRYFGNQRTIFNNWQKYSDGNCLNKYSTIKREIEEKIDNFYKIQNRNLDQEWDKINKTIKAGNIDIQDCINNGHISNDLYAVDTIKNFRERCPKHNAPTCRNSSPSKVRKSPALKISGAGDSCKAGNNCKEGITKKGEEKGKSQSRTPEVDSKTIRSPGADPKHQHQKNSIGQDQRNTNIISQPQPSVSRSDPLVVAEVKESEQSDNGDSTSSSREKAPAQLLPVLEPSKENTFETPPKEQHLQSVTTVKSDTGYSSQVRGLDENTPQSETPRNQTLGANTTGQQSNVVTVPPRTHFDGQAVAPNTHDLQSSAERVSVHHNHHHGDSISISTDDLRSVSSDLVTTIDHYTGSVTTNSESSPVEAPSSKREDSELVTSTGNILHNVHEFFDAIPNKEHVIKASAPMGIVLLLGLLFKYTPLWRVLTKKNRKKGAFINEELNNVLQEPSIMDDERSIPFSYGAFEYSTFDQNVY